ncbi:MAG: OFA family MFS transporter [bacterium]|nr:OFA family MFS transporter [bacterium]MBU1916906.1 OFA family MFS transporter [bacterium]
MSDQKVMNRWFVVLGAILIQLCLGAIYAWSVFTPKLKAAGWTAAQTQAVFAAGLAFFAIVMVFAGRMLPKVGPRKLTIAGGVVLGLGYALAGLLGTTSFWAIFLLVGVVGGSGIGLAYVVPIAVGTRWFPDKKGLIMGLAVAGFGFGAMGWVKFAGAWGNLIATYGLSTTFLIYGVAFFVLVCIGGIWMVFPPEGYKPAGWEPAAATAGGAASGSVDYTSKEMLKTKQFYMIFLCFVAGGGAGLMSIGLMKLYPMQALQANGISEAVASGIAGTAMAVFFSLANGLGRIMWGAMSDKLGRKLSITIMLGTQGLAVLAFPYMAGSQWPLWIFATIIGFNFGGNFALFPSITADTFGNKFVGQNYPWIFLAYGVGGILGPIMGGKLGDLGNFPLAFTICGVACLVAAIIAGCTKPPKKELQAAKAAA